jgi:hypothetical protein
MIRSLCVLCVVSALFLLPAFAKCPVTNGVTVVVKAGVGDLQVDTTSRESAVDVQIDNNAVQVQQNCGKDRVEFTSSGPNPVSGVTIWKILTPKNVDLDLITQGGSINIGDVNGNVTLHSGGSITSGQIKGKATLVTQGGSIKSGNIGGDAELRSKGGTLEAGDIGGNGEFHTNAGRVVVGSVGGDLTVEGGSKITITKAGQVKVITDNGDISIGDAARINAKSGGGHITSRRVSGPFQGHTEEGDIRLDSAGSWVEASTNRGNILVRSVPENLGGDLHMDLQAGIGDVTVYLPQRLKAKVVSTVQRPAFQQQIISEFPPTPPLPANGLIPNNRFYTPTQHSESVLNGGGNMITLYTSSGRILIKKN